MALSSVQIGNFALAKIGDSNTIESLTEDSTEASILNLWFAFTREQVLSAFNWSFARGRATLATHSEDPPQDWAYRYVYPATCLKARFIENPGGPDKDPIPYEVELAADDTKCILTDENEAKLIFTKPITSPSLFSPFFVELFATFLAAKAAFTLTGKLSLQQKLEENAEAMLLLAPAMDAQEKQERAARDAEHIRTRA
jgi:hypothetical protein